MGNTYSVLNIVLKEAKKWLDEIGDRPVGSKLSFEELLKKQQVNGYWNYLICREKVLLRLQPAVSLRILPVYQRQETRC
jgi:hypothetical protein